MSEVDTAREALLDHLAGGATTVCRCWSLRRTDGVQLAFTDHDNTLEFDGLEFEAETGLSAKALEMSTGFSTDNTEALGILSHHSIRESDIAAGRFDGASVTIWLVNWRSPDMRMVLFEGALGEITRKCSVFEAEIRGLTGDLNRPWGVVYQRRCSAVLGDSRCKFDVARPEFSTEGQIASVDANQRFRVNGAADRADKWFERGRLVVLSGEASGLVGHIKTDTRVAGGRDILLWNGMRADLAPGDRVRLEAGCDQSAGTCRTKFGNFLNFRGFPHLPTDDWIAAYPVSSGRNDGGSLWRNSESHEDV